MTIVTNTFLTFSAKGIREDLTDIIYNIAPTQTPVMSTAGKTKATQTFHEWQTDSLAAASTQNAQLQGDDISTFDPATATTRRHHTQRHRQARCGGRPTAAARRRRRPLQVPWTMGAARRRC